MSVNYFEYTVNDFELFDYIAKLNLDYKIDNYEVVFTKFQNFCNKKSVPDYGVIFKNAKTLDNCSKIELFEYFGKDLIYLTMSTIWGLNSYSERKKVGALIVKDNMIISDGYNGTPFGFPNICEFENGVTKEIVLHAEANCITKIAKSTNSSIGSTLYTTVSPCLDCAKLIYQSGISRVVFSEIYRNPNGIEFLLNAHINILYIPKFIINLRLLNSLDSEEYF